jgi:hypothetical protein
MERRRSSLANSSVCAVICSVTSRKFQSTPLMPARGSVHAHALEPAITAVGVAQPALDGVFTLGVSSTSWNVRSRDVNVVRVYERNDVAKELLG